MYGCSSAEGAQERRGALGFIRQARAQTNTEAEKAAETRRQILRVDRDRDRDRVRDRDRDKRQRQKRRDLVKDCVFYWAQDQSLIHQSLEGLLGVNDTTIVQDFVPEASVEQVQHLE